MSNAVIANTDFDNAMDNCLPGTYADGMLQYKRENGYCIAKVIYVPGEHEIAQVCKFPMALYKKMRYDGKNMDKSDFDAKYKASEPDYCEMIYK